MRNKKDLGAEVPYAIYRKFDERADQTRKSIAHFVRQAIYEYIDRNPEIEVEGMIKRIIENREEYERAETHKTWRQLENKKITEAMNEATFIEFMDNFLANIYIANKPHMSEQDVEQLLSQSLEAMRNRAEKHGFMKQYKLRKENPIEYASEQLDRKAVQKKALGDSDFY